MEFFDRLDMVRRRWNVLDHPFYTRWSDGELSRDELAFYAGEYRHAVVALADLVEAGARACEPELRAELGEHAAEERAHVNLWDDFARAVGAAAPGAYPPLPETTQCAGAWTAGEDTLERLAISYAVEAAQPAISRTKLEGLVRHYGVTDATATGYFALHAERDHEHAAHSRRLVEERAADVDLERLLGRAEAALRGNWGLLDGVEGHPA